jgi:hypothetical protein
MIHKSFVIVRYSLIVLFTSSVDKNCPRLLINNEAVGQNISWWNPVSNE